MTKLHIDILKLIWHIGLSGKIRLNCETLLESWGLLNLDLLLLKNVLLDLSPNFLNQNLLLLLFFKSKSYFIHSYQLHLLAYPLQKSEVRDFSFPAHQLAAGAQELVRPAVPIAGASLGYRETCLDPFFLSD